MKVSEPRFDANGELCGCSMCPLDSDEDDSLCVLWWYRKDKDSPRLLCPVGDIQYAEACALAEAAEKEGR